MTKPPRRWLLALTITSGAVAAQGIELTKVINCDKPDATIEGMRHLNMLRRDGNVCRHSPAAFASPLRWNARLAEIARRQAEELGEQRRLVHRDRADRALAARLADGGYAVGHAVENVGFGYSTAAEVIDAWRASGPHCANLMNAAVIEFGLACTDRDGTRYWALVLGAPPDGLRAREETRSDAVPTADPSGM